MATILIVDDDRDILEIERTLLVREGFETLEADCLEDALSIIESRRPDVVLLDLVFPEDPDFGRHAAREIRRRYPSQTTFLVTSVNREYLSGVGIGHPDFDEVVIKPIDIVHLSSLLRRYSGSLESDRPTEAGSAGDCDG